MFIKTLNTFLVIITFCLLAASNSYADELEFLSAPETIKELKESIDILDKENIELNNDITTLNTDYKLKSFLKINITRKEFLDIKSIVSVYNDSNKDIEGELLFNAKKQLSVLDQRKKLLEGKKVFYNGLIPYINTEFKDDYLNYIRRDADIFNKKSVISTDIVIKKEILDTKVTRIESKIIKHKEYVKDSVEKIIKSRIDLKITNLKENETFIILNLESKVKVLDKTIRKIKIKLQNLENSKYKTSTGIIFNPGSSILENKIQTYNIAVLKLEEFKKSIK